jgi:radical SAM superfamily enzyme YgiQ (UPF0313 family)
VVLGGVHASVVPTEGLRHADCVVVGEAEAVLGEVLADAASGRLRRLYHGEWLSMDHVPSITEYQDLYTAGPYRRVPIHSIQTSRGCRFNCSFCSVIRINGRGMRHMPPERVVEELRILATLAPRLPGGTPVYFVDDDLMSDRDYTAQMLEAIVSAGLQAPLAFQTSIGFARDEELMRLAAAAGCVSVFVGIESVSRRSLLEANKKNLPREYERLVGRIHAHGIGVSAGIIFGFDEDGPDVFETTVAELDRCGFDTASFGALTPLPGTHTFARLYEEERITTFDWSRFDAMRCVIEPARMTPAQLEAGIVRAAGLWSSTRARARRCWRQATGVSLRLAGASLVSSRRYESGIRRAQRLDGPAYAAREEDLAMLLDVSRSPASDATARAAATAEVRLRSWPS